MKEKDRVGRRVFLKRVAGAVGAAAQIGAWPALAQIDAQEEKRAHSTAQESRGTYAITFPRTFEGRALKTVAFPLGGVAAGSLSLGGRGQLCDWEIFNRPNKGYSPAYAFPSIWVQSGSAKPITRVLEARILPPTRGRMVSAQTMRPA